MKYKLVNLSDVSELITDGTHLSPTYVESGIPMLDSKHIEDDFYINDTYAEKFITRETDNFLSKKCKPKKDDILISSRGSIGKIALVREGQDFNIMGNMILVRLTNDINKRYFLRYLRRSLDHLLNIARGVAQKGLYLNQIRNLMITLPPLVEQERIAALLDTADNLLHKREQAITKLDTLAKSTFVKIFGNPITNSKNIKTKKVKEVCKLINGLAFKPTEWEDQGLPIIRIQNLNDENKPFNYTQKKFDKKYLIKNGDVLLSWSGTPGTSFGCFMWKRQNGWLNQHIFKVELNEKIINSVFFILQMNLKINELIARAHGGVGLKHVTKGMIDDLNLIIPTIEEQNKFYNILNEITKTSNKNKASYLKNKNLFLSLQHKSFAFN